MPRLRHGARGSTAAGDSVTRRIDWTGAIVSRHRRAVEAARTMGAEISECGCRRCAGDRAGIEASIVPSPEGKAIGMTEHPLGERANLEAREYPELDD